MTITAKWTTVCDGCGKVVEKEIVLNQDTQKENSSWFDIWGPGFPSGWVQINYDKVLDKHYLFFHNKVLDKHYLFFHNEECYSRWLREQGRIDEAQKFDEVIWVA